MTRVWQAEIEFKLDDDGDLTASVRTRSGSSSETAAYTVAHDSHFLDDAIKTLGVVARKSKQAAMNAKFARRTKP
jgi:hypothetical protein